MSNIRSLNIKYQTNSDGIAYHMFEDIPDGIRITAETPPGTFIWVAKEPKTYKFRLKKFHLVGEKSFPKGGYTLWDPKLEQTFCCYYDCAVIHPDNFKKSRNQSTENSVKKRKPNKKKQRKTK